MKEKLKAFFAAIGYLLLTVGIQLVISIIGGIGVGIYYVVKEVSKSTNGANLFEDNLDNLVTFTAGLTNVFLLISSIVTIFTLILIYKIKKRNYKRDLQLIKTSNINILFAIILGASCWLFNAGALSLVEESGIFYSQFEYMNEILSPLSQGSIILSIITVGIVAPIAEEFLFRGVVYNTLNRKISVRWTIIIQAILFGVFHGNLIQGSYATLLGVIFGYVTYKTKSLWPAIIMHMTNNLVATMAPYILGNYFGNILIYIAFTLVGIIGITVFLIILNSKNSKSKDTVIDFENFNNLN
ncbi:CPBP family intramembrane metalloprotease [Clostridium sp. Sa3CUN1]|uniref:CPBP family intramembrane metalloprotease n=1 Tax=Clostridium gallinarum TaxID=2762246 RepID=A0ABR8PZE1_9CLOT|nr:CPBP family intramembrane glutamic endopeptidase [Clostridium gallinarum]MBD7913542.1 CPBP family intramembrane metalloprotease [Clostridium gallinarum]